MKTLIVSILLFCASIPSFTQNLTETHYWYDTHSKMMQGYYHRGLYPEAIQYIDSLKENQYLTPFDYYFFARLYALSNQFESSLYYLEKSVKQGISKEQIDVMYDLDKFRESHLNIVFEINYTSWHEEYLTSLSNAGKDTVYSHEITALYNLSREKSRYNILKIDGDEMYELKDSLSLYQDEQQTDSTVFVKLTNLITEKGFPTYKRVGNSFYRATDILRLNYYKNKSLSILENSWLKIKPLIVKEMKSGNLKPFYLAHLEDLHRVHQNKPQVYLATKVHSSSPTQNEVSVIAPEALNSRRKSIGLCSIQIEYWSQAVELPLSLQKIHFK